VTPRRAPRESSLLRWAAALRSRYAVPDRFRPKAGTGLQDWVWLRLPRLLALGSHVPGAVHHWSEVRQSTNTLRERVREVVRRESRRGPTRSLAAASPSPSAAALIRTPDIGRPRVEGVAPPAVRLPSNRFELSLAGARSGAVSAASHAPTAGPAIARALSRDVLRELVTTPAPSASAPPLPFLVVPSPPILVTLPRPFLVARSQHFLVASPGGSRAVLPGRTSVTAPGVPPEFRREQGTRASGRARIASTPAPAAATSIRLPAPSAVTPLARIDLGAPMRQPALPSRRLLARRPRTSAPDPAPLYPPLATASDLPAPSWPSSLAISTVAAASELHSASRSAFPAAFAQDPFSLRRDAPREPLPVVHRGRSGVQGGQEQAASSAKGATPAPDAERIRRQVEERVERTLVERMERLVARELSPDAAPLSRLSERVSAELSEALVLERERLGWS
jgi:hypothetical protein